MRSVIIGHGEIGTAVEKVFEGVHKTEWVDLKGCSKDEVYLEYFDVMQVCIPYSPKFVEIVNAYVDRFKPNLTIIHSTVPIGTTRKIKGKKVHCPVRGRHSNLVQGIIKYRTFMGFENQAEMMEAFDYLIKAGISPEIVKPYETTEAAKLFELLQYGMNIEFARYAKRVCDVYGIEYRYAVKEYGRTHNETIRDLDNSELQKPILEPPVGKIGGHCVLPGIQILNNQSEDEILNAILSRNGEEIHNKNLAAV